MRILTLLAELLDGHVRGVPDAFAELGVRLFASGPVDGCGGKRKAEQVSVAERRRKCEIRLLLLSGTESLWSRHCGDAVGTSGCGGVRHALFGDTDQHPLSLSPSLVMLNKLLAVNFFFFCKIFIL